MRIHLLALAAVLVAGSTPLLADSFVPYSTPGSVAAATQMFATGNTVSAYFYSSNAGDDDTISVFDVTTGNYLTPVYQLDNHSSVPNGVPVVFSGANVGDMIAFDLTNSSYGNSTIFSSDPSRSTDGINHGYITPFSGLIGKAALSGYYIGMEDLPFGSSDLDYNDDNFVISGVTTVPEPGSFVLLATGLLGTAGVVRRRFAR
jgi:hypothetical protein